MELVKRNPKVGECILFMSRPKRKHTISHWIKIGSIWKIKGISKDINQEYVLLSQGSILVSVKWNRINTHIVTKDEKL
jgi:hypothetical protein